MKLQLGRGHASVMAVQIVPLCCQQGGLASGLFNDAVETDDYWVIFWCHSVENLLLPAVWKYKAYKIHLTTALEDGRNSLLFV